ncbi:MAG: TorD/DmsD family molecular chaperone [Saezia sp.]
MLMDSEQTTCLPPEQLAGYAQAFSLLGACYLLPLDDAKVASLLREFNSPSWLYTWIAEIPEGHYSSLSALSSVSPGQVREECNLLFAVSQVGPVLPWGSAYLRSDDLHGRGSLQALQDFLKREQIVLNTNLVDELSDHIGLMLYQAAFLAAKEREETLLILLREHLYTWLPFYFKRHVEAKVSPFYTALTRLTLITVESFL